MHGMQDDYDDGLDAANIAAAQGLTRQPYMGRLETIFFLRCIVIYFTSVVVEFRSCPNILKHLPDMCIHVTFFLLFLMIQCNACSMCLACG